MDPGRRWRRCAWMVGVLLALLLPSCTAMHGVHPAAAAKGTLTVSQEHEPWPAAMLVHTPRTLAQRAASPLAVPPPAGSVRVADFAGGGSPACEGTCLPACPCTSLQQALDAAQDGDEVWLRPPAGGAPIPCEGATTNRSVTLRPHAEAATATAAVTLDCGGTGRALWLDGRGRDAPPHVHMRDLAIRNGRAAAGGCVRADDVLLTVERCAFDGCTATAGDAGSGGGALLLQLARAITATDTQPPLRIRDCTFRNCTAQAQGGAVLAALLAPVTDVVAVAVSGCDVQRCSAANGGGVAVIAYAAAAGAAVLLQRSSFQDTHATQRGGAAFVLLAAASPDARVNVTDCTVTNGTAWQAGAMSLRVLGADSPRAGVHVTRSTFARCHATGGAGAVGATIAGARSADAVLSLTGTRWEDCSAGANGGAALLSLTGSSSPRAQALVHDSSFVRCASGWAAGGVLVELAGTDSPQRRALVAHCGFSHGSAVFAGGGAVIFFAGARSSGMEGRVQHCTFSDMVSQDVGGAAALLVYAEQSPGVTMAFQDSAVSRSRSNGASAGAVYAEHRGADSPRLAFLVQRSNFTHTSSAGWGGAVYMLVLGQAVRCAEAALQLADCIVHDAVAEQGGGGAVELDLWAPGSPNASLSVLRSRFRHTRAQLLGGAVLLVHYAAESGNVTLDVQHCHVSDAAAVLSGGAVHAQVSAADAPAAAVTLRDSTFTRTYAGQRGGSVLVSLQGERSPGASVAVADSLFRGAEAGNDGAALYVEARGVASPGTHLLVSRTRFQDCRAVRSGGAVSVIFLRDSATDSRARLLGCAFTNTSTAGAGGALYLSAAAAAAAAVSNFVAEVESCVFEQASAGSRGGAVFAILSRQSAPLLSLYCISAASVAARAWQSSSRLAIRGTVFRTVAASQGSGGVGGAVAVAGGELEVEACDVTDAGAAHAGGLLYTSASAGVLLRRVQARRLWAGDSVVVHHEGTGALLMQDSAFALLEVPDLPPDRVVVYAQAAAAAPSFAGSQLECGIGETFQDASRGASDAPEAWRTYPVCSTTEAPVDGVINMRSHSLLWRCRPCPPDTYFLGAGNVTGSGQEAGMCRACPFGATCLGRADVRAHPGMWGVAGHSGALPPALVRCAEGYCCADDATCRRFDSCAPTRTGVLCGDCEAGMTGVLGSTRCRAAAACGRAWQDWLFWPGTLVAALAFAAWQVRQASRNVRRLLARPSKGVADAAAAGAAAADAAAADAALSGGPLLGPAITKAAFAYYQSLPLLLIADPAGSPLLHAAWSAQEVFNFQLPSSAAGGDAGVCLFRGMTPVHREVVGMAAAAAVLLALPLLHVLHAVAARALPAVRPCLPARLAACLPRLSLPAAHVYAGAFTSLVMLTYATLTTAAMHLVTCVQLEGLGSRLLVQGSVECWRGGAAAWQWVCVGWLIGSTAMVPAALAWGGALLRRGAITPRAYWLSLLLPLPCMLLWALRHRRHRWQPHASPLPLAARLSPLTVLDKHPSPAPPQHRLLQSLPARPARFSTPSAMPGPLLQSLTARSPPTLARAESLVEWSTLAALAVSFRDDAWWWDAVLLLRRLALAALPLLLSQQPVMQALMGALVVLACLLLHTQYRPFASRAANVLELGFLTALLTVALLSVRAATLVTASITDDTKWRNDLAAASLLLLLTAFPLGALAYGGARLVRRCRRCGRRPKANAAAAAAPATLEAAVAATAVAAAATAAAAHAARARARVYSDAGVDMMRVPSRAHV